MIELAEARKGKKVLSENEPSTALPKDTENMEIALGREIKIGKHLYPKVKQLLIQLRTNVNVFA